jgi:hypothetical protein
MILDEFRKNNIWNQSWHVAMQDDRNIITWKKNNTRLRNVWSHGHLAWLVVYGVYYTCTIWWSYCLDPTCHIHMHGNREKLAWAFFLLHACWTSWLSSRRAQEWLSTGKGKEGSKDHMESGKSKAMLMGCSPRRATTVESGLCARPYMVYAR